MPARRRLKVGQVVRINFEARPDWDDEGWTVLPKGSIGIVSERVSRVSGMFHSAVYFGCIGKTLHIEETGLIVIDLDEKGRCCGRKPIVYKRPNHRLFCTRCDKLYDPDGKQIENWAWNLDASGNWVDQRTSNGA